MKMHVSQNATKLKKLALKKQEVQSRRWFADSWPFSRPLAHDAHYYTVSFQQGSVCERAEKPERNFHSACGSNSWRFKNQLNNENTCFDFEKMETGNCRAKNQ